MMTLACKVIHALGDRTAATAESCTGGMIGAVLTAVLLIGKKRKTRKKKAVNDKPQE